MDYKITLTTAEDLALGCVAVSQETWINNAIHERCRLAIEEVSRICIEKCLEENVQIPSSKEEMVILAIEKGWVKSAADRHVEYIESIQAEFQE